MAPVLSMAVDTQEMLDRISVLLMFTILALAVLCFLTFLAQILWTSFRKPAKREESQSAPAGASPAGASPAGASPVE